MTHSCTHTDTHTETHIITHRHTQSLEHVDSVFVLNISFGFVCCRLGHYVILPSPHYLYLPFPLSFAFRLPVSDVSLLVKLSEVHRHTVLHTHRHPRTHTDTVYLLTKELSLCLWWRIVQDGDFVYNHLITHQFPKKPTETTGLLY